MEPTLIHTFQKPEQVNSQDTIDEAVMAACEQLEVKIEGLETEIVSQVFWTDLIGRTQVFW